MTAERVYSRALVITRRTDPDDPWFMLVLPTSALRDLVIRQLRRKYPALNHCVRYADVNGYGVQLYNDRNQSGLTWSDPYRPYDPNYDPYGTAAAQRLAAAVRRHARRHRTAAERKRDRVQRQMDEAVEYYYGRYCR